MREQPELTVTEMATSELVPYARNAKIHTREQVEQIAKSIDEFGFNDPVGVWRNGKGELEIIEGHGRVLAAQRLGLGKVPVIELSHLSDAQRRAYTHVHNQLNMNTGWDMDVLALELGEIEGFDWEDFGFDGGVLPFDADDFSEDFELSDAEEPLSKTVTLQLTAKQFESVEAAIDRVGSIGGDGNKAGNAIAEVCRQWVAL